MDLDSLVWASWDAPFETLGKAVLRPYKLPGAESQGELRSFGKPTSKWSVRDLPISDEEVHDGDENNRADRGGCETVEEAAAQDA
jgi:hypothetical protein